MELKDLQETAALARLNMSGEELEKTFPAFEETLSFFAVMQEAGIDGKTETPAAFGKTVSSGRLRPDTVLPPGEDLFESMLSQAGERDGRFIVIPNVL